MSDTNAAIVARGVKKRFGPTEALRGLNLTALGSQFWGAFAWCAAITLIALPLSIRLFRRTQQG